MDFPNHQESEAHTERGTSMNSQQRFPAPERPRHGLKHWKSRGIVGISGITVQEVLNLLPHSESGTQVQDANLVSCVFKQH